MSFLDKFLSSVRLSDDDRYDDEYDDYEDDYEEERKGKKGLFKFGRKNSSDEDDEYYEDDRPARFTAMNGGKSRTRMQVCVIKPSSYDDVKEIADTLLSNSTVLLNMEGIDLSLAQRIIDFMTGSCYAIDGNLQKISNYIFIITPASVGISGDFQNLVDAFETARMASGQSFSSF